MVGRGESSIVLTECYSKTHVKAFGHWRCNNERDTSVCMQQNNIKGEGDKLESQLKTVNGIFKLINGIYKKMYSQYNI